MDLRLLFLENALYLYIKCKVQDYKTATAASHRLVGMESHVRSTFQEFVDILKTSAVASVDGA